MSVLAIGPSNAWAASSDRLVSGSRLREASMQNSRQLDRSRIKVNLSAPRTAAQSPLRTAVPSSQSPPGTAAPSSQGPPGTAVPSSPRQTPQDSFFSSPPGARSPVMPALMGPAAAVTSSGPRQQDTLSGVLSPSGVRTPVRPGEGALLRHGFGATVLQDALSALSVRAGSLSPARPPPHRFGATAPPRALRTLAGSCGRNSRTSSAVIPASGARTPGLRGLSSMRGSLAVPVPVQSLRGGPGSCVPTPVGTHGPAMVMSARESQGTTTLGQSNSGSGSLSARAEYKSPMVFRQYSALAPNPNRPGIFSSPQTQVAQSGPNLGGRRVFKRPGSAFSTGAALEIPFERNNPPGAHGLILQQGPMLHRGTSRRASPRHCGRTCSPSIGSDGSRSRSMSPYGRSRSGSVSPQQRSPLLGEGSVNGAKSPKMQAWNSPVSNSKIGSPRQRYAQVYSGLNSENGNSTAQSIMSISDPTGTLSPRLSKISGPSNILMPAWQRVHSSGVFASDHRQGVPRAQAYLDLEQRQLLPQRSFVARGVSAERRVVELLAQERPASFAQPQRPNATHAAYSPSFARLPQPNHDRQEGHHVEEKLASGARSIGLPHNSNVVFPPAVSTQGCASVGLPSPRNRLSSIEDVRALVRSLNHHSSQAEAGETDNSSQPCQQQQQKQQLQPQQQQQPSMELPCTLLWTELRRRRGDTVGTEASFVSSLHGTPGVEARRSLGSPPAPVTFSDAPGVPSAWSGSRAGSEEGEVAARQQVQRMADVLADEVIHTRPSRTGNPTMDMASGIAQLERGLAPLDSRLAAADKRLQGECHAKHDSRPEEHRAWLDCTAEDHHALPDCRPEEFLAQHGSGLDEHLAGHDCRPEEHPPDDDRMPEEHPPDDDRMPEEHPPDDDRMPEERHPSNHGRPHGTSSQERHPSNDWPPEEHHPSNDCRPEAGSGSPSRVGREVSAPATRNSSPNFSGLPMLVPPNSSGGTAELVGTPHVRQPVQAIHGFGFEVTPSIPRVPPPFTLPKSGAQGGGHNNQSEPCLVANLPPVHEVHAAGPSFPVQQESQMDAYAPLVGQQSLGVVDDGIGCEETQFDRAAAQHARLLEPSLNPPEMCSTVEIFQNKHDRRDREEDHHYNRGGTQQSMTLQGAVTTDLHNRSREYEPGNILGYDSARSFEMQTVSEAEQPKLREEEGWQTLGVSSYENQVTRMNVVDPEPQPHSNISEGTEAPERWPWHQTYGEPSASTIEGSPEQSSPQAWMQGKTHITGADASAGGAAHLDWRHMTHPHWAKPDGIGPNLSSRRTSDITTSTLTTAMSSELPMDGQGLSPSRRNHPPVRHAVSAELSSAEIMSKLLFGEPLLPSLPETPRTGRSSRQTASPKQDESNFPPADRSPPSTRKHAPPDDAPVFSTETEMLIRQQQAQTPQGSPESLNDTREVEAMVEALREFDVQISTKGNLKKSTLRAVSKSRFPPNKVEVARSSTSSNSSCVAAASSSGAFSSCSMGEGPQAAQPVRGYGSGTASSSSGAGFIGAATGTLEATQPISAGCHGSGAASSSGGPYQCRTRQL